MHTKNLHAYYLYPYYIYMHTERYEKCDMKNKLSNFGRELVVMRAENLAGGYISPI